MKLRNLFKKLKIGKPLIRDSGFLFPRIIHKTKVRGKTVIYKPSGGKSEAQNRIILSQTIPKQGKYYSFQLSKRYPRTPKQKRWEKYYDLPSLKDIFDKNKNRRLIQLMKKENISFDKLFDYCLKGYNEMENLFHEYLIRDGTEYTFDLGPDQFMVDFKNGKPNFILIDS